jgi:hypothetical protein
LQWRQNSLHEQDNYRHYSLVKERAMTLRLICAFVTFFCGLAAADGPSLAPALKVSKLAAPATVTIQLTSPQGATRIWKDSNSWGAARWRVFVLRHGKIETFFQTATQLFTVNVPAFDELPSGGSLEKSLDLSGQEWRSSGGSKPSFESGDTVIVAYDVPLTPEAHKLHVWYGVTAVVATVP